MENRIADNQDQLLESTYNEALLQNEIRESRWKNFKEEHEAVIDRLFSLRDKLKHDIMVPIGKLALMKGKLVHTNEVLVNLGDSWFAKKSAAEAAELCKRRIKDCDEMLDKLKKERDLLTSRKTFPMEHDLFSGNEIIEPYDEAAEAEWREKHRERVKAYKQEERRKRQENKIKEEKDIFELLDALELQEEEEDKLNRLGLDENYHVNTNEEDDDNNDGEEDQEEEEEEEDDEDDDSDDEEKRDNDIESNTFINDEGMMKVEFIEKETIQNIAKNVKDNKSHDISSRVKRGNFKNSQKVSFAEEIQDGADNEEGIEPVVIHFKHSEVLPKSADAHIGNSNLENIVTIQSPSDIYKTVTQSSGLPKSILKKSVSFSHDREGENSESKRLEDNENQNLSDIRRKRSSANQQVKIGDIIERSQVPSSIQISSTERPVSKFKAARLAGKK